MKASRSSLQMQQIIDVSNYSKRRFFILSVFSEVNLKEGDMEGGGGGGDTPPPPKKK